MAFQKKGPNKGLMVFRYNLRIHDNLALKALAASVDQMDAVFVMDPEWLRGDDVSGMPTRHGYRSRMGPHRKRFLWQSLYDLREQLKRRGSNLTLITGDFMQTLVLLLTRNGYTSVAVADHPGHYEQRQLAQLQQRFATVKWIRQADFTLFSPDMLPFTHAELPDTFSKFRKAVRGVAPPRPADLVGALPEPAHPEQFLDPALDGELAVAVERWQRCAPEDESTQGMLGGESAALDQLNRYIHLSGGIRHYKETRNGLEGWAFSSKLSPWLAQGCVSPRMVYHEVLRHEERYGRNDSTEWLIFELLWREYFQWMAHAYGAKLFCLRGIKGVNPLLTFYPEAFMAWREANTPSPFVNAFMKQLKSTGWMSNRGRQIVASYLVNELGVDWRYGAAWFEEMLIDYDCGANWGNWQYLAGVGADPRGRRRFNIEKQQAQYDPDGEFVRAWGGDNASYAANLF